jgi:RNA polymerase sigma-70 factor (ECF subfamily)
MPETPEGFIPDDQLVERAAAGDYAVFEELVHRHASGVYHLALKMLHNAADAEEVLQDTFLSAYTHLKDFRRQASFKTWVYRIAANQALTRLRKDKKKLELWLDEETDMATADWTTDPEIMAEHEELRRRLMQAVDALPPAYRAVFWLRDVEGLSTQEVADVLDLEVPNVKTRLLRARLKLRELLSDYVGVKS